MSRAGKRRRAREMAVQMLYQQEQGGASLDDVFASFDVADYLAETTVRKGEDESDEAAERRRDKARRAALRQAEAAFDYARRLVRGTVDHHDLLDAEIRRHAENWRLERMPAIDRNILRLAIYEMLHEEGVPHVVIVDEAIELAKKFGSESSGRFVNGLLDGVLKSQRQPATVSGDEGKA